MSKKKFQNLVKKAAKFFKSSERKSMDKQSRLIDKWYPQNLTEEEIAMREDFDSLHDFQLFISAMKRAEHKLLKNFSGAEKQNMKDLLDCDGTSTSL